MLFDLRGRGRRRTVQAIYLSLAVLMAGGLVLFGVGTGGGGGGLLNAFNPNSGSGAAKAYVSQQTKNAEKAARLNPSSPQVWANLITAHYQDAGQQSDQTTGTFTAAGKADLRAATAAWLHYEKLVKTPDSTVAVLAARAYESLGQFSQAAQAWQIIAASSPKVANDWYSVAVDAYQAKEVSLGQLAGAKAIALVPRTERTQLITQLNAIETKANPGAQTTPLPATTTPTVTTTAPTAKAKTTKGKTGKGKSTKKK